MTETHRRIGGLVLALLFIPAVIGLLACLPVPIGDPERSRIDSDLTGSWVAVGPQETNLIVFEPYDKRTWLTRIEGGGSVEWPESGPADMSREQVLALFDEDDDYQSELPMLSKAWRTRLGKRWFMTWEPKREQRLPGDFEPDVWFVYRIDKVDADTFTLRLIYADSALFEDVQETRRAYERVIKRNADNPLLYAGEDDESYELRFHRLPVKEAGEEQDASES